MSMLLGCLLESATSFASLLMTMAPLIGFVCAFAASDSRLSSVYCSKVPGDGAVVDSTALTGCGGGRVTCLTAACLAASFHVLLVMAFSDHVLVNGLITTGKGVYSQLGNMHWKVDEHLKYLTNFLKRKYSLEI